MKRTRALGLAVALGVTLLGAAARAAETTFRLAYEAPPEPCPDRDAFLREINARNARLPPVK